MPFAYYNRLTANEKKIYRRSDQITTIDLPNERSHRSVVEELAQGTDDPGIPFMTTVETDLLTKKAAADGDERSGGFRWLGHDVAMFYDYPGRVIHTTANVGWASARQPGISNVSN